MKYDTTTTFPTNQQDTSRHLPVPNSTRQNPSAISQVVDVINTKQTETDILASVVGVPVVLAAGTGESAEDVVHAGVLGEVPVAREDKDVVGGGAESLVVVEDVPHAWGAVLGCAEAG